MNKKTHEMKLVDFAFNLIKNGKKDIELRLYDEKRQLLNVGDYIEFRNIETNEIIKYEVVNLHIRDSFKELWNEFDIKRFGCYDNEGSSMMDKFYSKEEQEKYKVVGIEIKEVNND